MHANQGPRPAGSRLLDAPDPSDGFQHVHGSMNKPSVVESGPIPLRQVAHGLAIGNRAGLELCGERMRGGDVLPQLDGVQLLGVKPEELGPIRCKRYGLGPHGTGRRLAGRDGKRVEDEGERGDCLPLFDDVLLERRPRCEVGRPGF